MRQLILALGFLCLMTSCSKGKRTDSDKILDTLLVELDGNLKFRQFDEGRIENYLDRIERTLQLTKERAVNGQWATKAIFKYNYDSSVTFIKSRKEWKDGFKKEVIIHINDSLLFIKTYEALTENQDPSRYELVATIEYLSKRENLVALIKREYPKSLNDTVQFKHQPYKPLDLGSEPDYFNKLNYSKRIMNLN